MTPEVIRALGKRYGRPHFAAGQRFFGLLAAGITFVPLIFVSYRFVWALLLWDVVLVVLFLIDLKHLPSAKQLSLQRTFAGALDQLEPAVVTLTLENASPNTVRCQISDAAPESFTSLPVEVEVVVKARGSTTVQYDVLPSLRGDSAFAKAYVRYEGALRIAQAWAAFDLEQKVRVYPALRNTHHQEAMLMRARQIEMQRRMLRQRGHGREFESLREFQSGDERRDICWTATARRSKLVTTLRQTERSQTIWTVVDCGRLMRARMEGRSKLDYAAETAIRLAQLANYGGDTAALLAYGQRIQQRRAPGRGSSHLHAMLDQLAILEEESGEADHLHAAATLLSMQKRRSMVVWITDLADMAITPEVVTAALQANKRHMVVVAILGQPDVLNLTSRAPETPDETFLYAAASETIRRRELMMARLRSRGVHVIEVNAPQLTGAVLNKYLEVKQKNLL
jgi:uncharacterized protein (DUF58 family)